jgi:hypothetical protein
MAKQNINVGTTANDKKGDSLRAAFQKVNANFTELYAALGLTDVTLNLGAFTFTGSTMSTDDSTNIVIDRPITVNGEITVDGDIVPKTDFGASLGTPTKQFKSLYVSTNTVFLGGVPLSLEAGTNELTINNVPVSQTINYADIPNAPKDLSDLTDNSGSLGGGVTSYNDLTNKPTLFSGSYNDLTNKPNLAGTYQFSVAADDSTQRVISTDEVIKFIGAGGITTASDAEGNITITGSGGSVSSLVNGANTVSLGSTGTLTVPANGIITAPINQEFQLQVKDTNSVLRNEINLDPNNGTYMSVWSDETTSFSSADWGSGSWNNESGLGAARFTDAQALQNFWTTGIGSLGVPIEASINGGARTPNVFYENNNGETYGVYLGLDAVPPGGQGTTVPITSLVFYYQLQSKINIDSDGGEILVDAQAMDLDLRTTNILDLRANQNLNLRGLGAAYPVRIYTNNNTRIWEFDSTGSLTLPREGKIYGIGDGVGGGDRYGYISWDGNSSGDGSGFNTMRLVPDLQGLEDLDQYIILDPTGGVPGHIHIRAGGTQDNSLAHLFLGGEHSHVKISAGLNPPVTVMANDNAWIFGTDGAITTSDAFTVNVPSGVPNSVANYSGGGGWNSPPYTNLATTGGTGTGLTVNVSTAAGGYININAITINTPGTGYTNGDVITINNENNIPATFTIGVTANTWQLAGGLKFPDNTVQTTAAESFSFSVAADDSTQRAISNNELIKFIGAGGVTTGSDAEGNITITGSGGGSSIPAVVTTGAVGVDGAAHCKVQFTVASATTVTAVGVTAIGVSDPSKGTVTLSGSPGTGAFNLVVITNTTPSDTYILMPFATNASGTGYGAPITGAGTNPCYVRGTLITMADMSRVAVENITYSDNILVWDFDLGEFASAKPLWIKKTQTTVVSCLLTFSDHSELRIVGDSPKAHRIFNKEAGKFTYGSMPETPIGTTTFNDQGEEITLISKEWIVGEVEFYNVITDYHMNLFANSILTSMRYNNLYPITDMKFVKDGRTLRTADNYPNVEERLYKGFRLAEQTQSVEEIETHIQWLLSFEVERETECV